ncbi:membrane protein, putative [Babesia bigemina]|uniref:Membrane protein, putative n=1 Tax=Babesia bigemina TaxID=5866 RepID=A0A061DD81_BABBI|nr:membrane protein, putative [Babesia bigemina]CDR97174.1 membrane protein, putative [Babesia bigemina]|eukprot:XP_012769360.1 membrane protein, putative [Babesia bigemina]
MNVLGCIAALAAFAASAAAQKCLEFVPVDISIPESTYYVRNESGSRFTIVTKSGKCIGTVSNSGQEISKIPETGVTNRRVSVQRLLENEYVNTDLKPAVEKDGYIYIVEVETIFLGIPNRQKLVKTTTGEYEEYSGGFDDLDICGKSFESFVQEPMRADNTMARLLPKPGRRMGSIVCGDKVLLEQDDEVFFRYAEFSNNIWHVFTTPNVGNSFKTSFLPVAWKDCMYRTLDHGSLYIDLSKDYRTEYCQILSTCGENCVFFDGCSDPDYRVVDILDQKGVVYMGNHARCVQLKMQVVEGTHYLTVYARLLNGLFEAELYRSSDGRNYTPYKPEVINLELTNTNIDERIQVTSDRNGKVYTIPAPNNLLYTIGAVTYMNKTLVGKSFLEDPDKVPYVVLSRRITVVDEYTTVETQTNKDQPTNVTYVTNKDGVWLHRPKPVQFELTQLNANDPNFRVTRLEKGKFHVAAALPNMKIGSIKYKNTIVAPNQSNAISTEFLYDFNELLVTEQMNESVRFHTKYVLRQGFLGDDTMLFVERHKQPHVLKITDVFNDALPEVFCRDTLGKFVKIYVCKDLFNITMGAVTFGDTTLVPYNRYFKMREVYVAEEYFMSYIVVRSFTEEGDSVVEAFRSRVVDGEITFVRMRSKPVTIDLAPEAKAADQVVKVQDGNNSYYRIKPEFAVNHRIGDVRYDGRLLIPDGGSNLCRVLNTTAEVVNGKITEILMYVGDIGTAGRKAKLLTANLEARSLTEVPKRPLEIDISFKGTRDDVVEIAENNDTISYYVPWMLAGGIRLDAVVFTNGQNEVDVLIKDLDLDDIPEVRLHHASDAAQAVVAITPKNLPAIYANVMPTESTQVASTANRLYDEYFKSYYGEV